MYEGEQVINSADTQISSKARLADRVLCLPLLFAVFVGVLDIAGNFAHFPFHEIDE